MFGIIVLFLPILFVRWLRDVCSLPRALRRSAAAGRARHRRAGTIGLCVILGVAALWYGSILVIASLPRPPAQESLADYAERRAAEMTLEDLRRRYSPQALP